MARFWRQIMKGEKGQALPIVLALLVLGGLIIVPSLSLASASLNAGKIVKENVKGVFAADAGVEHAIWCIKNSALPAQQPYPLPENVNLMQVEILAEGGDPYTLAYEDEVLSAGTHYNYLTVDGVIEWDPVAEAHKYTITVTRQPDATGEVKLIEVGGRLPVGYDYDPGSAALFGDNLSTGEPDDAQDAAGAHMLSWEFPKILISEGQPAFQSFYFTGEGDLVGDYTWVRASRADIGAVGEVTGMLYTITAIATRPGDVEPIATVKADVIWDAGTGETRIILWQINPP